MTDPAPLFSPDAIRRARSRAADPPTSLAAAAKARAATRRAIGAVEAVMADGLARTDEQIHEAVRALGVRFSADAVRHARLALGDVGRLVADGERETSSGSRGRVWRWA